MLALAKAFASSHAEAAADVLDGLPAEAAAALLTALPPGAAGNVLVHMRALNCLKHIPADAAAACLYDLAPQPAAEVLRRLDLDQRAAIIASLPRARRLQIDLILRQPTQTVGAWMETRMATARVGSAVAEVRRRLVLHDDSTDGWLFVIGPRRQLVGAIPFGRLMTAPGPARVETLLRGGPSPLRANVVIGAAIDHGGWRDHDVIPVVDGQTRLVGVLSHASLRRALAEVMRADIKDVPKGTLMDVANIWYLGMAEIMNATIARKPDTNATGRPGETP
jgi:Mg/Co/Ni transporter MgtE